MERYASAIAEAEVRLMTAANYLEADIVIDNQIGATAGRQFDALISRADISRQAYHDYGKGNHPARLNFGDCFAYAP